MTITKKGLAGLAFAAVLALLFITVASASDFSNVAYVQTATGNTSIPIGHAEFCKTRASECGPNTVVTASIELDEARWSQLVAVNALFNQSIVPVTDADLYQTEEFWTYPNGFGDCEDFVLAKRRALIEAGWPASTLLMAVVRETSGNGHAVLLVRTDRGDLVLDNQTAQIDLWSHTPYQFVKRQDQAHAGRWVDMIDTRGDVVEVTASY